MNIRLQAAVACLLLGSVACTSSQVAPVPTGAAIGGLPVSARSAELVSALAKTAAWPSLVVIGEEDGSAGRVTTTATIDHTTRASRSVEKRALADRNKHLVTEQVLINSGAFVRNSTSENQPGTFSRIVLTADEFSSWFSRLSTLGGRSYSSLAVIADFIEFVPYSATALRETNIDGERCQGTRLEFRAVDIQTRLATRWNVADASYVADEATPPSRFEIWTNRTGEVRRVVETGTHFEDGEAIPDVRAQLTFIHPTKTPVITAPAI